MSLPGLTEGVESSPLLPRDSWDAAAELALTKLSYPERTKADWPLA